MPRQTAFSPPPEELLEIFRRWVEASPDLMTVVDEEGRFLYVNRAAERVFGIPPEECLGRPAFEFIHPEDRQATAEAFRSWIRAAERTSFSFENRSVSTTGEVRTLLWTVTRQPLDGGSRPILASSARDITASKLYQQELLESEVRLKSVLSGMLDPVITIDPRGIVQDTSESVLDVFGYEPEELVGRNVSILMPEPYRSEHDGYLAHYRRTGATNILGRTREFEVVRKDGTRIFCELSVSRIDVPRRLEPLFCGSFRDITARREAERALAESERRFRAIFDQEFQFVALLDTEGLVLEANQRALEAAGLERADVVGRPFWDTAWWRRSDDRERIEEAVRRAARGELVRFETEGVGSGKRPVHIDFSIKPVLDEEGSVALLLPEGRDISRIRRAQERENAMLRSFAMIGESASLMAHEIKNPITSVNVALRAVADRLGEDQREVLDDLAQRMQQLERLMRRTLSLARPLDLELHEHGVRELVSRAVETLRPELEQAGVEVDLRLPPPELTVDVDGELIGEVLTNLVRNAIDALGGKGRIRISARGDEDGATIAVEDDGPGIPDSQREEVFKPFVTTKFDGTGIGLPFARKIVEDHRGTLALGPSELGGARFEVRLPGPGAKDGPAPSS